MAATKITPKEFVEALKDWSILDVVEAVKAIEDEFGIKAAAPVAVGAVAPAVDDLPRRAGSRPAGCLGSGGALTRGIGLVTARPGPTRTGWPWWSKRSGRPRTSV